MMEGICSIRHVDHVAGDFLLSRMAFGDALVADYSFGGGKMLWQGR